MLILVIEGWYADDHLVEQDTKRPPVKCVVVTRADYHLRREILWRSTERVWLLGVHFDDLCETEVRQLYVTIRVQQDVLWLQISVEDLRVVEIA